MDVNYEQYAKEELNDWRRKISRNPSLTKTWTKGLQNKVNQHIPKRIHDTVAAAVRQTVETTLSGSQYITNSGPLETGTLQEREKQVDEAITTYKRTASLEGAGTGLGGILFGLADLPLLLGIKMRFLFQTAHLYGFNPENLEERLFLLHIFQMAFSSEKKKQETLLKVEDWDQYIAAFSDEMTVEEAIDWVSFQLEYRDFIDVPKTLQLIPGFGAIVGATINYHFLDYLGETAKNCYRTRWFAS